MDVPKAGCATQPVNTKVYAERSTVNVVSVRRFCDGPGMIAKLTGAAAAAVIVATIVFWLVAEIDRRSAPTIEISAPRNNEPIVVEVAGAVATPGVYELRSGDRVVDLIESAGGLLPVADTAGLNQAALLIDGERVTVLFEDASESAAGQGVVASPSMVPLLNLNTATVADLDELPGIGDVRANAIVAYRNQHGPFRSIEELLFVDGISENLLEEIRPYLTIDP
jgi:competence protein ComEA